MRAPVDNLESNWAYMVMTALAWNMKAWWALLLPERPGPHAERHLPEETFDVNFRLEQYLRVTAMASSRSRHPSACKKKFRPSLELEILEVRTLPSGDTLGTASFIGSFPFQTVEFIENPNDQDLFRVNLAAGQDVTAEIDTQAFGSPLFPIQRIFDSLGNQMAIGGAVVAFVAPSAGSYFVGISGLANFSYDPNVPESGSGFSTGPYLLKLSTSAPPAADLVGRSFDIVQSSARWGDTVTIDYSVTNSSLAAAGAFQVELRLSGDTQIDGSDLLLTTTLNQPAIVNVPGLAPFETLTGSIAVVLPDVANAPPLPVPVIGMRIDPANTVLEGDETNNSGQRHLADWDTLLIETAASQPPSADTMATALPVTFNVNDSARTSGFIETSSDWDLFKFTLAAGERVTVDVDAQSIGSGLNSFLRVFKDEGGTGRLIAFNDDFDARDSRLTFQAPAADTYYIGISSFGNSSYDPVQGSNGTAGTTAGLYTIQLTKTPAPQAPDLVGASFQIVEGTALWGESVTVNYTIQNRGGGAAGPFNVELYLSADNRIDGADSLLTGFSVAGLAAGASTSGSLRIALPGSGASPPSGFTVPDDVFLGFRLDVANAVAESNEANNSSQRQGSDLAALHMLTPQAELEVNNTTASANAIAVNSRTGGTITAADVDFFKITLSQSGRLTVGARATGFDSRLSLFDQNGALLIQSDGQSFANRDDQIVQHLDAGNYFLKVEGIQAGVGTYSLTTEFLAAIPPFQLLATASPSSIAQGDLNGDAYLDIVTTNLFTQTVSVFLGVGDGSFQNPASFAAGFGPNDLALGDFDGDGYLDILTANQSNDVSVLLGTGDGTFQSQNLFATGSFPISVVTGDFNRDGRLDIATGNRDSGDISVLLGLGNGSFQSAQSFTVGPSSESIASEDFNSDGFVDLVACYRDGVAVLLGRGNGTFQNQVTFPVGTLPGTLTVADFNGDGHLDLAAPNTNSASQGIDDISILLGLGNGAFSPDIRIAVAGGLVAADFDGDGHMDLGSSNGFTRTASILLGSGFGTFEEVEKIALGTGDFGLVTGDFNDDGRSDLATANFNSNNLSILLGAGNGTLLSDQRFRTGSQQGSLIVGDFDNDGHADLFTTNGASNDFSTLLGVGDATFQDPLLNPFQKPRASAAADFNGDGRLDLAITTFVNSNGDTNTLSIFLGVGDGTYRMQGGPISLGVDVAPNSLVAGDFNRDGRMDLAVAKAQTTVIDVFLGQGDGTFQNGVSFAAGGQPTKLVAGDLNRDGILDLAATLISGDRVAVLLGVGNGTFQAPRLFAVGPNPVALVLGDFNGDRSLDLATANGRSFSVLMGQGTGVTWTFQTQQTVSLGSTTNSSRSITAGDFNGDTNLDLAMANDAADNVSVFLGSGNGTFQAAVQFAVGDNPNFIVTDDFNNDGIADLATANFSSNDVSVLVGAGDGTFFASGQTVNAIQTTPLVGDVSGDGVADVTVLGGDGRILFRAGQPGNPGVFGAPIVVNPLDVPGRDLALVVRNGRVDLAALDLSTRAVSLYSFNRVTGRFTHTAGPTIPGLVPVRIAAGDLNLDGRQDLVVTAAASNQVFVYLQNARGGFSAAPDFQLKVGVSPLAVQLVDMDGDNRGDIVVTNQFSGDVSVLRNLAGSPFSSELRFRAGGGLDGLGRLIQTAPSPTVRSREGAVAIVTGQFNADAITDLIALDAGSAHASLLLGTGKDGGLFNPQPGLTLPTDIGPSALAVGLFTRDANLDLAILNERTIQIFAGSATGQFTQVFSIDAGNFPTGLSSADINKDGNVDLLVGNEFGDVLVLLGNGDGTFKPFQRVGQKIPLGVIQVNGQDTVVLGNESLDRISLAPPDVNVTQATAFRDRQDGVRAPGNLQLVDLNKDGIDDLVVANGGSNNVLVYMGQGGGVYGEEINGGKGFFVGTNPAGITVADVNGDTVLDLVVANKGSNDVSILLGKLTGATWTATTGPRLSTGGLGPTATVVQDVDHDGKLDILVANSQSNSVGFIPGVSGGFFNDSNPTQAAVGNNPVRIIPFGTGFLTLNFGDSTLTRLAFNAQLQATGTSTSGGLGPVSALAGDFNNDGNLDLLVANNQDGNLSLFLDEAGQLVLTTTIDGNNFGVPHPSDVAVSAIAGNRIFYATSDGVEKAVPFFFDQFALEERGPVAELLPFEGSNRTIVAALVTASLELGSTNTSTQTDSETNFVDLLVFGGGNLAGTAEGARGGASDGSAFFQLVAAIAPSFQLLAAGMPYLGTYIGFAWTNSSVGHSEESACGLLAYSLNPVNWWSLAKVDACLSQTAAAIGNALDVAGRAVVLSARPAGSEPLLAEGFARLGTLSKSLNPVRHLLVESAQQALQSALSGIDSAKGGTGDGALQAIIDAVSRSLSETGKGLALPLQQLFELDWPTDIHSVMPMDSAADHAAKLSAPPSRHPPVAGGARMGDMGWAEVMLAALVACGVGQSAIVFPKEDDRPFRSRR